MFLFFYKKISPCNPYINGHIHGYTFYSALPYVWHITYFRTLKKKPKRGRLSLPKHVSCVCLVSNAFETNYQPSPPRHI